MLIYIAGKYSGDTVRNVDSACSAGLRVMLEGNTPLIPHSQYAPLDGLADYRVFMNCCLELLSRCDRILMLKGYEDSPGAVEELAFATTHGIEVEYEE